jgi:protein SCO1/2
MGAAVFALLAVAALAACSSSGGDTGRPIQVDGSTAASSSGYRGDQLPTPVTLSATDLSARFTDSAGASTSLSALQPDKLMLLYFGYTHCPDVCPTTMADLGLAMKQLPIQTQTHVQVVFVTSDPQRDTPPVMKAWLANFDTGLPTPFVGLTAPITQIDSIATSIGVPLSPPVVHADGTVTVEHGAQTLAFLNGKASLLWLAGTSVADYAHDITALAQAGLS